MEENKNKNAGWTEAEMAEGFVEQEQPKAAKGTPDLSRKDVYKRQALLGANHSPSGGYPALLPAPEAASRGLHIDRQQPLHGAAGLSETI